MDCAERLNKYLWWPLARTNHNISLNMVPLTNALQTAPDPAEQLTQGGPMESHPDLKAI